MADTDAARQLARIRPLLWSVLAVLSLLAGVAVTELLVAESPSALSVLLAVLFGVVVFVLSLVVGELASA